LKKQAVASRLHVVVSPPFVLKAMPINADNGQLTFFVSD
jgi:hypothetical protein